MRFILTFSSTRSSSYYFRYKPKVPLEKLSDETRARHEELSQALRQVARFFLSHLCAVLIIL